jgi:hypothetical protein
VAFAAGSAGEADLPERRQGWFVGVASLSFAYMQDRAAFPSVCTALVSLALFASAPAQASFPGPLTEKDVDLRLVSPMPTLSLTSDDWSPGREHIEIACIIRDGRLDRCRVDSAMNAERDALNWAFDYSAKVRLPSRDRGGSPTSGRTFLLKWDLKPAG